MSSEGAGGAMQSDSFVSETEFINSKAYLLTNSTSTGLNLCASLMFFHPRRPIR